MWRFSGDNSSAQPLDGGEALEVKPAGSYAIGSENEAH